VCCIALCGIARCVALRCVALRGVALRGVVLCGVVWRGVALRCIAWCGVVWCDVAQPPRKRFARLVPQLHARSVVSGIDGTDGIIKLHSNRDIKILDLLLCAKLAD
jgi:hypothetical protein